MYNCSTYIRRRKAHKQYQSSCIFSLRIKTGGLENERKEEPGNASFYVLLHLGIKENLPTVNYM